MSMAMMTMQRSGLDINLREIDCAGAVYHFDFLDGAVPEPFSALVEIQH